VIAGLRESLAKAHAVGIDRERIVVDPGFGFGKRGPENMTLLAGLSQLRELGYPVLAGSSRKRFLTGGVVTTDPEVRLAASTAANVAAVLAGAQVLRIHDVAAARAAVSVTDVILAHKNDENTRFGAPKSTK
jgi:dihydropteroate synthase